MALLGTLEKGDHFITSSYEHPAILELAKHLIDNSWNRIGVVIDKGFYENSAYSKEIIKFHKNRPIYTKKDEFNGNFDICYFCINNLPSENVSTI